MKSRGMSWVLVPAALSAVLACNGGSGGTDAGDDLAMADPGADPAPQDILLSESCGACPGGTVCRDGRCQCPASQVDCFGTCKPLGTNSDCSDCSDQCAGGMNCQGGVCRCPAMQKDCSGTCRTMGTDNDCSGCDDACVGVKTCQEGHCVAVPTPECLPGDPVPCVIDADCPPGHHCNEAISPPTCQKLYCGGFGSACSEDGLCLSRKCRDEQCVSDCSGLECGPDPKYGETCGTCTNGRVCTEGQCICRSEDHKGCCGGNVCWLDSCGYEGTVVAACPRACLDGKCVDCAAVGQADCSGICLTLGTNSDCSKCGDACSWQRSCQDGTCKCPADQADCSGTCTFLGTDSDCSKCRDACSGGTYCQEGTCRCPPGQTDCSGTCTTLGTDSDCSRCSDRCLNGQACQSGQCQCVSNHHRECFGENLYWFDSCGVQEQVAQTCDCGCQESSCTCCPTCAPCRTTSSSDGCGGTCSANCTGTCSGSTCCSSNAYKSCYGGNLYWYDSCGNRGTRASTCECGCSGDVCTTCCPHKTKACYGGSVYWYDSCGNREELYQGCADGCSNGSCCTSTCSQEGKVTCSGQWGSCCGDKLLYSYGYTVCQRASSGCLMLSAPIHCPGSTACPWGGSPTLSNPCNY